MGTKFAVGLYYPARSWVIVFSRELDVAGCPQHVLLEHPAEALLLLQAHLQDGEHFPGESEEHQVLAEPRSE